MVSGRNNEIKYLEDCYHKDGSSLVVMYGRDSIGKTSVLKEFIQNKEYNYYLARAASEDEQMRLLAREFECQNTYESVFGKIMSTPASKKLIIIDEFHFLVKNSRFFMDQIINLLHENWNNGSVMIVLCSSAFTWVENDMVSQIGNAAYEISGFLKLKELSFLELVRNFPNKSFKECMSIYAVLGGVPGLWNYFSQSKSVKENICDTLLNDKSVLYYKPMMEIKDKLREPAIYSTILSRIAAGDEKLNDIYEATGFVRAKISVYLKNLMELEIVEKVYSVDTAGRNNVRKGVYRIKNHLLAFYFTFIFPNQSDLYLLGPEGFYDKHIAPALKDYEAVFFKLVCREYMRLKASADDLPIKVDEIGSWCGKSGDIDILGISKDGGVIAGICLWNKDIVSVEDFDWLRYCLKQARLKGSYYYIFSGRDFDDKLKQLSAENPNIQLIGPDDL